MWEHFYLLAVRHKHDQKFKKTSVMNIWVENLEGMLPNSQNWTDQLTENQRGIFRPPKLPKVLVESLRVQRMIPIHRHWGGKEKNQMMFKWKRFTSASPSMHHTTCHHITDWTSPPHSFSTHLLYFYCVKNVSKVDDNSLDIHILIMFQTILFTYAACYHTAPEATN